MDRLSILLTMMTGAVLTGGLTIAGFTMGYYNWTVVLASAAIGFLLAWPTAYYLSRLIKRRDRNWDHSHAEPKPLPDPSAKEV